MNRMITAYRLRRNGELERVATFYGTSQTALSRLFYMGRKPFRERLLIADEALAV